jgi:FMN reductase
MGKWSMSVFASQHIAALLRPSLLAIAGNVRQPSRTRVLVDGIVEATERAFGVEADIIDIAEVGPTILSALTRPFLSPEGEAIVARVEAADLLIIGTPVYRASYTGALKHLFDLVNHEALVGKPVILAATGGSHLHGLITEHQLRPLLSFFGALAVPTAIYATEADFDGYSLTSRAVIDLIDRAVGELAKLIASPPAYANNRLTADSL